MAIAQVSPKGQVLIPKRIRDKYGVKPGSSVQILEEPQGIVIRSAPEDPIKAACGFLEGDFSLTQDLIWEHQKEQEGERSNRPR
jgi:AbrB family looped-hinge helix DNA binding protein